VTDHDVVHGPGSFRLTAYLGNGPPRQ